MKEITLSQWKIATIDDCDFEEVSKYKWFAKKDRNTYYAITRIKLENWKYKTIQMHAIIAKTKKWLVTDHIDRNWLNNSRENLRICTNSENAMNRWKNKNNTSWLKWISYVKNRNKWSAEVIIRWKKKWIWYFEDKIMAYNKYCEYCMQESWEFYHNT